jgi:hypothetical protein
MGPAVRSRWFILRTARGTRYVGALAKGSLGLQCSCLGWFGLRVLFVHCSYTLTRHFLRATPHAKTQATNSVHYPHMKKTCAVTVAVLKSVLSSRS